MADTLKWSILGEEFEDGSKIEDWQRIERSPWQWQYDSHELAFDIYEHDGQYWKLYRVRWVAPDKPAHAYGFGGQACRMAFVEYTMRARSPHSARLMQEGDLEWVRTYEVDETLHMIVKAGKDNPKYGPSEVTT